MVVSPPRSRSIRSYLFAMRLFFCAFVTVFFPHSLPAATEIDGLWDASVLVGQAEIPFPFEFVSMNGQVQGFFFEGDKKIGSTSGRFVDKELQLQYEFLNATLTDTSDGEHFKASSRYNCKNGKAFAFHARRSRPSGLESASHPQIAGSWEMKLVGEDKSPTKDQRSSLSWKLYLRQSGQEVSGSILRIDGDTGTLAGRWRGNTLVLSHFAGERPVLFEASLQPDGTLDVTYNRLNKYLAARIAHARAKGIPEPPDSARFTSVRNPGEPFQFQFPDLDGTPASNTQQQFRGKVVLVTIGGPWCPNCRDEAPFLHDLYRKYHAHGLEIVSLSFEAAV